MFISLRRQVHTPRRSTLSRSLAASNCSSTCRVTCVPNAESPSPSTAHLHDVSELASAMRAQVRAYTAQQQQRSNIIRMVGILADSAGADAEIYSARIQETFSSDGLSYEMIRCAADSRENVETVIREMNRDDSIHGILVYYPIFKRQKRGPYLDRLTGVYYKTDDDYLRDVVAPEKDVEGLSHNYTARWFFRARGQNRMENEIYIPCTALSVLKILDCYHHDETHLAASLDYRSAFSTSPSKRWQGVTVTIINRSEIFGRPLAAILALEGAMVYSVDEYSILQFLPGGRLRKSHTSLENCVAQSSIVVTGVPSEDFVVPCESIQPGTTVVNVSEFLNVCLEQILQQPNVKLVPHIGKVTVASLEQNLIRLHQAALRRKHCLLHGN